MSFRSLDKSSKRELITVAVATILFGGYFLYDVFTGGVLTTLLSDRDNTVALVKSFGFLAPLCFIVVQILQTVVAPIPGQITGAAGGYIFGWWGVLWSAIGNIIGYFIIFQLSKKFGRKFLEKIIKPSTLERFSFVNSKKSAVAIFLIFLIPGLPDDIVGYLAGLTEIPTRELLIMAFLGHLPSFIVSNYIGMGLGNENLLPVIIFSLIAMVAFGFCIYYRDKIIKIIKK